LESVSPARPATFLQGFFQPLDQIVSSLPFEGSTGSLLARFVTRVPCGDFGAHAQRVRSCTRWTDLQLVLEIGA